MSRRELLYSLSKANEVFSQPRSATVILLMVLILPLIKIWVYLWYQHFKIKLESLHMFSDWSDLFGSTRGWYDLCALYFLFQTCSPFLSCIPVRWWALPEVSPLPHVVSFTHTLEYPVQWSYSVQTDYLIWPVVLLWWFLLIYAKETIDLLPALSRAKSSFHASIMLTVNFCSSLIKLERLATPLFSTFQASMSNKLSCMLHWKRNVVKFKKLKQNSLGKFCLFVFVAWLYHILKQLLCKKIRTIKNGPFLMCLFHFCLSVYQRSHRLCFGGFKSIWIPAIGEPAHRSWDQTLWRPICFGDIS